MTNTDAFQALSAATPPKPVTLAQALKTIRSLVVGAPSDMPTQTARMERNGLTKDALAQYTATLDALLQSPSSIRQDDLHAVIRITTQIGQVYATIQADLIDDMTSLKAKLSTATLEDATHAKVTETVLMLNQKRCQDTLAQLSTYQDIILRFQSADATAAPSPRI